MVLPKGDLVMLIAVFGAEDLGESAFGAAWAGATRNDVPSAAVRTSRRMGESCMRKLRDADSKGEGDEALSRATPPQVHGGVNGAGRNVEFGEAAWLIISPRA